MRNTFKVLFYIKKNAPLRNGNVPIMGRITVNGQRTQFSTQLSVDPEFWDIASGRMAGRNAAAMRINEQLSTIRYHVEKCYNTLFHKQMYITATMVKELYFGAGQHQESILSFFRQHNDEFRCMVGISRSKTTYYKYRCVCTHLEKYIQARYNRKDLIFKELDRDFLTGFHAYITQECGHKKNTTWIYMIALKHILMLARGRGFMSRDLFSNYKLCSEFVTRNYLTVSEITNIIQLRLEDTTLQLVRDAFIFSCFTGLSYVDICDLTPQHIQKDGNQLWINTKRRKTGAEINVRLFSVSHAILLRNSPLHPYGCIFDLPSNGWSNFCLEKIVTAAGINKHITFHVARHTFATTITLSQGVAIETISKLLGHKNIRTTQIYATITHSRLNCEMERLSKRIDSIYNKQLPDVIVEPI